MKNVVQKLYEILILYLIWLPYIFIELNKNAILSFNETSKEQTIEQIIKIFFFNLDNIGLFVFDHSIAPQIEI